MISASFSRKFVGLANSPLIWKVGLGAAWWGVARPVELNSTWSNEPETVPPEVATV